MAGDQDTQRQPNTDGCTTLERRRWLCLTREAAAVVGGSDQSWQTAAVAVMTVAGRRPRHTDDDGRRQETPTNTETGTTQTAAPDSRGNDSGLRLTREAAAAVGGSDQSQQTAAVAVMMADGDRPRHTETGPTQTAAPHSRGNSRGCVRLERQRRRSVDQIGVSRQRQWQ